MAKRAKAFNEHFPVSFDSPESKLIAGATYDSGQEVMTVHFAAGTTYTYSGIDHELWWDFTQATSKGNFFGKAIRPMFAGKLVTNG